MDNALIVSASEKGAEKITEWLAQEALCTAVSSLVQARQAMAARQFDLLIINAPLPGEDACAFALHAADMGVILLVPQAGYEATRQRMEQKGIMTLAKPLAGMLLIHALSLLRASRTQVSHLAEKLTEVRMVERAKWALIQTLQMNEAQAHRYIEKQAMDQRRTRREVAENIIKTYEN